ncbi:MAG: hypothetical protein PCFJNLEI_03801 [Verrucomicrobiae bacterium]|nr:hypothetical protein [Verrucomicrobiae bacterium]
MNDWAVVLLRIGAMFLVICVGWIGRRRGFLANETTGVLSRLVVDVAFPALGLTSMLRTIDPVALRANWFCPLLGLGLIAFAYLVTALLSASCRTAEERHTCLFLTGMPNYIFLPLPIVEGLYGNDGVRVLLLYSIGAALGFWTIGVWVLTGRKALGGALRQLAGNAGLWATIAGIVLAIAFPPLRGLENLDPRQASLAGLAGGALIQALAIVGNLTIPLSLLAIGAQLGGLTTPWHKLSRPLWSVVIGRLLVAPLATFAAVGLLSLTGARLGDTPRMVGYLIAMMPVGLSCAVMVERFGGDTELAAQGVFYTTLFSILTVPGLYWLVQRLGL